MIKTTNETQVISFIFCNNPNSDTALYVIFPSSLLPYITKFLCIFSVFLKLHRLTDNSVLYQEPLHLAKTFFFTTV